MKGELLMEDKIKEIREQINQTKTEMDARMDSIMNGYQNQIDDLRNQYNSRMAELEGQGMSSSDIYIDEQLVNLNNEITRLTNEADKAFEDLNKELDSKLEDLNKQLEFEEDKARRIGEKNKELDDRMKELEQQGVDYGEMQLDPEIIRIQNETEAITNELFEEEKNDGIKEYADLKEQKAVLEKQLEEAKKTLEEQNESLEKEKSGREEVIKQLKARNNTNSPEYKEYTADIKKIEELLSENSKKAKIDEFTKNISDIEERMSKLEEKFGKEVLEPVAPELKPEPQPQQQPTPTPEPEPQPQAQQSSPEPEPEPQPHPRKYGRRFNSEPNSNKQVSNDNKAIKYKQEPLTSRDCFTMARTAYEMMTDEDKVSLEYAKEQLTGNEYLKFMQEQFPQLLQGNSEVEQRMICDALNIIHSNELKIKQQAQQKPLVQPKQVPQVSPKKTTRRSLDELMEQVKLDAIQIDLSTGELNIYLQDNGKDIDIGSKISLDEKVDLRKTRRELNKNGIDFDINMDPMMVEMICNAIDNYFGRAGVEEKDITPDVYKKYIEQYGKALNAEKDEEYKLLFYPSIEYIKSDPEKVINDARKKRLDEIFGPYIRKVQYSPCAYIDKTIDTRNWMKKLADRLRNVFNPQKKLPAKVEKTLEGNNDVQKPAEKKKGLGEILNKKYRDYRAKSKVDGPSKNNIEPEQYEQNPNDSHQKTVSPNFPDDPEL